MPCNIVAAASWGSTPSGSLTALAAETATFSAYEPMLPVHATLSPTARFSAPAPSSTIVPAPSTPGTSGIGIG